MRRNGVLQLQARQAAHMELAQHGELDVAVNINEIANTLASATTLTQVAAHGIERFQQLVFLSGIAQHVNPHLVEGTQATR